MRLLPRRLEACYWHLGVFHPSHVRMSFSGSPAEVGKLCEQMLGHKLKTKQTIGDGVVVRNVSLFRPAALSAVLQRSLLMLRASVSICLRLVVSISACLCPSLCLCVHLSLCVCPSIATADFLPSLLLHIIWLLSHDCRTTSSSF